LHPAAPAVDVGKPTGLALERRRVALAALAEALARRRQRGEHEGEERPEEDRRPPWPPSRTGQPVSS